jgi:hypothetical protein
MNEKRHRNRHFITLLKRYLRTISERGIQIYMIWPGLDRIMLFRHNGVMGVEPNSATNPRKERARTWLQHYNKGMRFPLISLYALLSLSLWY